MAAATIKNRLLVFLGYATMIVAAPVSQYLCVVWVVGHMSAGFNSAGGVAALVAVLFGWLPGSALAGAIGALGDRSHFQLITAMGLFPTLVSCATVNSPF